MHGFTRARLTLVDYVTRWNLLVLSLESDTSVDTVTIEHLAMLGEAPRISQQWTRRMQYRYASLAQLRAHRQHDAYEARCQMCNEPHLFYGLGLAERKW